MQTLIVRGHYTGQTFIPDGPLPDVEGPAILRITPTTPAEQHSAFEALEKAPVPRSREDIDAQIREERESWGDS